MLVSYSLIVIDPKLTVIDPKLTVTDPKVTVIDPKLTVIDPKVTVIDSKLSVLDPKPTWLLPVCLLSTAGFTRRVSSNNRSSVCLSLVVDRLCLFFLALTHDPTSLLGVLVESTLSS